MVINEMKFQDRLFFQLIHNDGLVGLKRKNDNIIEGLIAKGELKESARAEYGIEDSECLEPILRVGQYLSSGSLGVIHEVTDADYERLSKAEEILLNRISEVIIYLQGLKL